jgi:transposase-like protein
LARGRKKGNTGKRYTEEQKREILDFVASQGRGGITAAGRKYGVSYIALRRWMNGAGGGRKGASGASKALDGRRLKTVASALAALKSFKKQVTVLQRALKQLAR